MKKHLTLITLLAFIVTVPYSFTEAHSGRTDSNGGHYNRKTGEYHYHNGGTKSSPRPKAQDTADIKRVQERLNELGYDCGVADGIKGSQTEQAIKDFQSDKGLEADGIVGPATRSALGL